VPQPGPQYLDRIHAYDQQGPAVNSMLYINPASLKQADAFDQDFQRTRKLKPLGCIPIVLKDNFDTADMPTTAGSLMLKGAQPEKDVFRRQTAPRCRCNHLGKANLQEFASGGISVSSLGGQVKNPYDLTRTPGGSSAEQRLRSLRTLQLRAPAQIRAVRSALLLPPTIWWDSGQPGV